MKFKSTYIAYILGLALICGASCSRNRQAEREFDEMKPEPAPWEKINPGEEPQPDNSIPETPADEIPEEQPTVETTADTLPPLPKQRAAGRIPVRPIGRLWEVFNDSNYRQYAYAEKLGIAPIHSLREAYRTRRPIIKIESNDLYVVDSLTHSLPYLVPEAAKLLDDIARNFRDSLSKRGGYPHLFRVTSLLRTPHTVKRLRRVNRNATDSSTHQFGTTFDISYARFYTPDSTKAINDGDLKNLLGEVLYDLRRQGRCLVKYERKSPCYHITVTK